MQPDPEMGRNPKIWAVVPVKESRHAKQRLSRVLDAAARQQLALAMFEDVMDALAASTHLSGILVPTIDPAAARIAIERGARVIEEGACAGHTAAVAAAARQLADE